MIRLPRYGTLGVVTMTGMPYSCQKEQLVMTCHCDDTLTEKGEVLVARESNKKGFQSEYDAFNQSNLLKPLPEYIHM